MNIIEHKSIEVTTEVLSEDIALKLQAAIRQNQIAKLLVSGGKSPIPLFEKLSRKDISWKDVIIGLVDERYVDTQDASSNEKLVRDNLMQNNAKQASFLGLVYDMNSKNKNIDLANQLYRTFSSGIDVCVLGMGTDGHTASLFPKDINSRNDLASSNQELLIYTHADVAPFERITCTKNLISRSHSILLMISGEEKLNVLRKAKAEDLPIAHFFQTHRTTMVVHYNKI